MMWVLITSNEAKVQRLLSNIQNKLIIDFHKTDNFERMIALPIQATPKRLINLRQWTLPKCP